MSAPSRSSSSHQHHQLSVGMFTYSKTIHFSEILKPYQVQYANQKKKKKLKEQQQYKHQNMHPKVESFTGPCSSE
jgi:hypothetical protein